MHNDKENEKSYAKFQAEVWANQHLRRRLISDPATVLKEAGFGVSEGKELEIIETAEPALWSDSELPAEFPFSITAIARTKCH